MTQLSLSTDRISPEIDAFAKAFKSSRCARFICRLQYHWLKWRNTPLLFEWVGEEGEPVGEPIEICHLRLHDMMEHEALGVMTEKVLLEGLRANAFQVLGFEHSGTLNGKTTIQPRWA